MARHISNRNFLQSSSLRNRVYCLWSRATAPTYRKDVFRMASQNLFEKFDHSGRLLLPDAAVPFGEIPWTAHPAFEGVSLKPLVCSEQTGGQFSFHLVRIAPNREIGLHVTRDRWKPMRWSPAAASVLTTGPNCGMHRASSRSSRSTSRTG